MILPALHTLFFVLMPMFRMSYLSPTVHTLKRLSYSQRGHADILFLTIQALENPQVIRDELCGSHWGSLCPCNTGLSLRQAEQPIL